MEQKAKTQTKTSGNDKAPTFGRSMKTQFSKEAYQITKLKLENPLLKQNQSKYCIGENEGEIEGETEHMISAKHSQYEHSLLDHKKMQCPYQVEFTAFSTVLKNSPRLLKGYVQSTQCLNTCSASWSSRFQFRKNSQHFRIDGR